MNRRTSLLVAAMVGLSACASLQGPATITETAARTPQLSTLTRLLTEAGLADTLKGPGPFTVFAPTDEAFKAVPAKTMQELAANKDLLRAVLTYHVLPAKVMAADVKTDSVATVQGGKVAVSKAGAFVTVDEALVTEADIAASNGVVHIVDKVLMPPKK